MEIAEFSISDVINALRQNKLKVSLCFVLIMGCTLALNLALPRIFESEAQLLVRLGRENATLDTTTTLGEAATFSMSQTREFETNSVATMLRSRSLAEQVVDVIGPEVILNGGQSQSAEESTNTAGIALRLAAAKAWVGSLVEKDEEIGIRDQAIRKFEQELRVEPVAETNLIRVAYQSRDPEFSQTIVANLIDNYSAEHVRIYRATGAHQFLEEQKQRLQDELSLAESKIVKLKIDTGLVAPGEQRVVMVERMGVIQTELFAVEAALVEAQTEYDDLESLLATLSHEQSPNAQAVAGGEVSDAMRTQLYGLQLEAQNSLTKYNEDHVKARQLRRQIAAGKNILAKEEALLGIQKLKPFLKSQQAKAETLKQQIVQIEGQLRELSENEMLIAQLQRTVDLRDATFRQVSADAEQSRIDHSLELAKITNISVAQPASLDLYPVFPNTRLNLVVAFFVAIFSSASLAVFVESLKVPKVPSAIIGSMVTDKPRSDEHQLTSVDAELEMESMSLSKPR